MVACMRLPLESDGIRWNQGDIFRAFLSIHSRPWPPSMVFLYVLQRVVRIGSQTKSLVLVLIPLHNMFFAIQSQEQGFLNWRRSVLR